MTTLYGKVGTLRFLRSLLMISVAGLVGIFWVWPSPSLAQVHSARAGTLSVTSDELFRSAKDNNPLLFVENVGQFNQEVHFQINHAGQTIWLARNSLWISHIQSRKPEDPGIIGLDRFRLRSEPPPSGKVKGVNLRLSFPGSNSHPVLEPFSRQETLISYFKGRNSAEWQAGVPVWGGVRYKNLYPGIDLEIMGENGQLIQRLVCKSNCLTALNQVRLRIEGANNGILDGNTLRLETAAGEFRLPLLQLEINSIADSPADNNLQAFNFQPQVDNQKSEIVEVAAPFLARLAPSRPEFGPVASAGILTYSTFLGGDDFTEEAKAIAVDDSGAAYVLGVTSSLDFPATPGAFDTSYDNTIQDLFIAKLNPSGSDLVYATFLGGSQGESVITSSSIAVDKSGSVYVVGNTDSDDFPTTPGAYDAICGTESACKSTDGALFSDAVVVKLNPSGTALVYSTFIGGAKIDSGLDIDLDGSGAAYVIGQTLSPDFPTTPGAYAREFETSIGNAFVVKFNPAGTALSYSTFIDEGNCQVLGCSMAVNPAGETIIAGNVSSSNFIPTPGAYDTSLEHADAFVARLNSSASGLIFATFLGGDSLDSVYSLALDEAGNIYLTGSTESADFPTTPGAFDRICGDDGDCRDQNGVHIPDAFAAKLSSNGSSLLYGTFLGGSGADCAFYYNCAIAVDEAGNAYITGETYSSDFPVTPGAYDVTFNGGFTDAFVVRVNPDGSALDYATFLGGKYEDAAHGIAVGETGVYITGETDSPEFPTVPGSFDTSLDFFDDVFVTKMAISGPLSISALISPSGGSLISPFDGTTYQFLADTFTMPVTVTHTLISPASIPPTGDLIGIRHFFRMEAVYTHNDQPAQPAKPFTIEIRYRDPEIIRVNESSLALYSWKDNHWLKISSSMVDPESNTLTATTDDFSVWAALGETRQIFLPVVTQNR